MLKIQVSSTRPKEGKTCMEALLAHLLATIEIKCEVVPDADGDVATKMEWLKTDCWDIIKILRKQRVQIVDYSPQTEAIPKVPTVTDTVSRIRQALVAALDYAREMEVANCIDKFEEALALLDQKLSGWQLPEDQLDGGFDLEWMKRVMNVEAFDQWPRCYFNSSTFFDISTGNVMVHCGPAFEILTQIYDREQFVHFMLGMHLQPFLKHPEMREIVQDEKVVLCGTEIVEAMMPDGTAIRKTSVFPPKYGSPLGAALLPPDKHQGHHEASDRRAKMVATEVPIAEYEARLVPPEKIRDLNQAGEHVHGHPSGIPPLGAPHPSMVDQVGAPHPRPKPIFHERTGSIPEYLDPVQDGTGA